MMPETFTGWRSSKVGENFEVQAAVRADWRKSGWPLVTSADITSPFSLIKTLISTVPEALTARAAAGYVGFASVRAFPFRTPPLTGLTVSNLTPTTSDPFSSGAAAAPGR